MNTDSYYAGIYAIFDTVAGQVLGGLYFHKHEAAAIRFFSDVAMMDKSQVGQHPGDYELIRLGWIAQDNKTIVADYVMVLSGAKWAAAQGGS